MKAKHTSKTDSDQVRQDMSLTQLSNEIKVIFCYCMCQRLCKDVFAPENTKNTPPWVFPNMF